MKYCSRDCQVSHWKKHKKACIANAAGSPVVADEANKAVDRGTERRKAANAKDSDGRTPLWHAAKNGDLEAVQRLVAVEGVDIDAADQYGHTPLHLASHKGHECVARVLLDNGANLDAANKNGQTPLHMASYKGHESVVRLLLDKGAKVGAADRAGNTPLHMASVQGHESVARLLLDKGAKVEAADKDGRTSLHAPNTCIACGKKPENSSVRVRI